MSNTAVKKQLKIKTGVVQRLWKEAAMYRKETGELEARRNKLVADGAEEWDTKNAEKMVIESQKMIIDCTTRLGKAVDELVNLTTSVKDDSGLNYLAADDEDLVKAEKILKEVTVKE